MNSLVRKLKRGLAIGLFLGLSSIYSLGCGQDSDKCYINESCAYPKLEITSNPITSGKVNESYNYQLETSEPSNCKFVSGPIWLNINNNLLQGTPTHISNDEVGRDNINIECNTFDNRKASQKFSLDVEPGLYEDGKIYDQIQKGNAVYDLNNDGINDINIPFVVLCETGYCPDLFKSNKLFKDNRTYFELRKEGIKEGLESLLDIMKIDFIFKNDLPIKIHLNADSTCNNYGPNLAGTTRNLDTLCDYTYDHVRDGRNAVNFKSCLSLDPNYSYLCSVPSEYVDPDSLEANGTLGHEAFHLFSNGIMSTTLQENFSYALQCLISGDFNCDTNNVNSFCDLNKGSFINGSTNYLYGLCQNYGIDSMDLDTYFQRLEEEFYSNQHIKRGIPWAANYPIGSEVNKCFMDSIASDNMRTDTSVYNQYYTDVCNNLFDQARATCSANPLSINYINPNYCGK